jgi:hypothetical protein
MPAIEEDPEAGVSKRTPHPLHRRVVAGRTAENNVERARKPLPTEPTIELSLANAVGSVTTFTSGYEAVAPKVGSRRRV